MVRQEARIVVGGDGVILDATEECQVLLGLTLAELRALPPGALSLEEDKAASEGFEAAWTEAGRGEIMGTGTARLPRGSLIRVRYLITPRTDDTYEIILEQVDEAVHLPPRTYTVGGVLSAWRAAERKLEAVAKDSEEWLAAQSEIDYFRAEYQRVTRRGSGGAG